MKNVFIATIIAGISLATIVPADAYVGVGHGRRGVGVGRPGVRGVGGWGRVGRPGFHATPFRPFVGPR